MKETVKEAKKKEQKRRSKKKELEIEKAKNNREYESLLLRYLEREFNK